MSIINNAWHMLAAYIAQKRSASADALLQVLLEHEHDRARAQHLKADVLWARGDTYAGYWYEQAIKNYEESGRAETAAQLRNAIQPVLEAAR